MISAFFFLGPKGDLVISRYYRDDIIQGLNTTFKKEIILSAKSASASPVNLIHNTSFMHIKVGDLYFLAVTKRNANAALVFQFLNHTASVLKAYFGDVDENVLKNNFVLVYELLDEILDFGYPQTTDIDTLKLLITQGGVKANVEESSAISVQATGVTGNRRPDIKYKNNEFYLDVLEDINMLVSSRGTLLHLEVSGKVMGKCYLSGMPECTLGLNDKLVIAKDPSKTRLDSVLLDDCTFHPCVKLNKFQIDRTISFAPPDGEFQLMRYRTIEGITCPFKILPTITEKGRTRIEMHVTIKSVLDRPARNVVITIPCPPATSSANVTVGAGRAKYDPIKKAVIWKIRDFSTQMELVLMGDATLVSTVKEQKWSKPPISMQFLIEGFSASGMAISFLRIQEKSSYSSSKFVKYVTTAGSYEHRI